MLQFWKKNGKKEKTSIQSGTQKVNGVSLPVGVLLPTFSESNLEGPLVNFQHDGYTDTPPPQRSRLSISLSEVLFDRVALLYFSQFAEIRGHSLLLNLWLDLQVLHGHSVNGGGDCANERTYGLRGISEGSVSPITRRKVCHRYLTEEMVQRYRFSEELCTQFEAAGLENTDDLGFQQLEDFVYQTMRKELWHDFVRSEFYSKFQIEVLTSGGVTLSDILYHSNALNAFTEFLDQEGCRSVVEFWLTATAFQSQLRPDSDANTSQNEAINIYDKYLSLQATCPLGVDDATRCEVEHRICVEDAVPRNDCLEPALRKAWAYLRFVCLPLFLSSQCYVQLISELMRASRANSSPASSVTDFSVESRGRYDPDLIWRQRNQNRGLSIGRIDQLGRFETDIEPEPDKKSESRITRVVKKFVNKEEHKQYVRNLASAQEEMAWRVAEMIVKDVTNLTMGGGGHADDEDT